MNKKTKRNLIVAFYAVLAALFTPWVIYTLVAQPLFPLNSDSLTWSNAWLMTTVLDYYIVCLCFCGVVIASEKNFFLTIIWLLTFLLLGSPFCCLWIIQWLIRGGNLRLRKKQNSKGENLESPGASPLLQQT